MSSDNQASQYDPNRDYSDYEVSESDGPLVSVREAKAQLGVGTTEAVRSMIKRGRLPTVRLDTVYNAKFMIPVWAVEGLAMSRGERRVAAPGSIASQTQSSRIRELENALVFLREARDHEVRARDLQAEAHRELAAAYDVLFERVSSSLIPEVAALIATGE